MFGILTYVAYSARLTSLLAIKEITHPFHDKESFLAQNKYQIITVKGTILSDKFQVNSSGQK